MLEYILPITAIASVVARMSGGVALDTLQPKYVLSFGLALQVCPSPTLPRLPLCWVMPSWPQAVSLISMAGINETTMYFAPCVQGLSMGVVMNVASVAYANYFGRAHVGGITGIATSALVVGSAVGPFPFGLVRDLQGGFAVAFVASGGISLVLAVVVRLPCLLCSLVAHSLPMHPPPDWAFCEPAAAPAQP